MGRDDLPEPPPPGTFERYLARFNELPAVIVWISGEEELDHLMEQAIKDGKPLTEKDLLDAQGMVPKPDDADY